MNRLPVTKQHEWSHCVEFVAADFAKTGIDLTGSYGQMQHFQWNYDLDDDEDYLNTVRDTVCPQYDYERNISLTQNLSSLKLKIAKLQSRAGTSIFLGLKWGLALLDSSMQTVVTKLITANTVDGAFAGRPKAYPINGAATDTQKVIVLMTDGQNDASWRLTHDYYNSPSAYAHWANHNFWYYWDREVAHGPWKNVMAEKKYDSAISNIYMDQLCTLAKAKEVIIYAVAVEATPDGQKAMAKCASSTAHYHNVSGADLETVFNAITKKLTELRFCEDYFCKNKSTPCLFCGS